MNFKRKLLVALVASTFIGVGTGTANAVGHAWLLEKGFYGSPVQSKPDTTVTINSTTEDIRLEHFATVKFEDAKGQSFVWRFDSAMEMSNFLLKTIAPAGFGAGNARVIIWHPTEHYDGG